MNPELLRQIRRTSSATNLRAQRIERAIEKRVSTPIPPKNDIDQDPEGSAEE